MLEWMLFRVIMVAFFILASSFFVAAEFALVSVRETRIQQLIALGRPGARTALKLKHSIDEFLPAVQLGVTVAGLALGWIGEPAVAETILTLAAGSPHPPPHRAPPEHLSVHRPQAVPSTVTRRRCRPLARRIKTHRHRPPPHGSSP